MRCNICGEDKEDSMFYVIKGKVLPRCKDCERVRRAKRKDKRAEYDRKLYEKNSTSIIERVSRYDASRKVQKKEYDLAYRPKLYSARKYRYRTDPVYRLSTLIRGRTNQAIRRGVGMKRGSTKELLGCTFEELCKHIESQFTEGMSWDKVMSGEIHIDHRLPIAAFDLSCESQQRLCFHYTNLQPLWASVNNFKRAKVGDTHWSSYPNRSFDQ